MTEILHWVDQLPERWAARRIKHVVDVAFSNVDKNAHEGEVPVRLCNYTDVYNNEAITAGMDFMAATATPREMQRFGVRRGDVIVTKDSEAWDDIAVPALVSENIQALVCGYHLALLRPKPAEMLGAYLLRALQSSGVREQFHVAANGVTRFGLGQSGLRDALIPVPPLSSQRAIADFLDRKTRAIDELILKKERLIELLQEKRQALINKAVTKGLDPDVPLKDSNIPWLGEVPAHWRVLRIGYLARVFNGSTPSRSEPAYWVDEGIPWLSSSKVNEDPVREPTAFISRSALRDCALAFAPRGSIIVGMVGQGRTRGMAARLEISATINQNMAALVPSSRVHEQYLYYVLRAAYHDLRLLGRGANQPALNCEILKAYRVPVPPYEEQQAIADEVSRQTKGIGRISELVSQQLKLLREHRQALISAAVTGQISPTSEAAA